MAKLFLSIVEITLGTSLVVLLLLILQPLTAKFLNRKFRYWAWLILAVRLLIPFSFTPAPVVEVEIPSREIVVVSPQENIPVAPPVEDKIETAPPIQSETVAPPVADSSKPSVYVRPTEPVPTPVQNTKTIPLMSLLSFGWALGACTVFLIQLASYFSFAYRTRRFDRIVEDEKLLAMVDEVATEIGVKRKVRLFRNSNVQSPILIGFLKPAILIPKRIENYDDILMILRHEIMHLKRGDTWYKLALSLTCALHWFNPLVWIMSKVASDDLENACDEDVVKNKAEDFRHAYCESILRAIRSQKSREPFFTAGFSSKPSDIKARFLRILDNTRKSGGKIILVVLLIVSFLCGTLFGYNMANNVVDTITDGTPSGTNSGDDGNGETKIEAELEKLVKLEMDLKISEDDEILAEVMKYYNYETITPIDETVSRRDTSNYRDETDIIKTAVFRLTPKVGEEKLLMMTHRISYYSKDGEITSKSADMLAFSDAKISELSCTNVEEAKIFHSKNQFSYAVRFESDDLFLMPNSADNRILEVYGQDKENPLIVSNDVYYGTGLYQYLDNATDEYVKLYDVEGNAYLGVYNSVEKSVTSFGDKPLPDDGNVEELYMLSNDRVYIARENGFALYNFASDDKFTPYAVIDNETIGTSALKHLRRTAADRNNENRICTAFRNADDTLGFVTYDLDGNVINSFLVPEINLKDTSNFEGITFVDNIAYFTTIEDGYFKGIHRAYVIDVREGQSNKPVVREEREFETGNVELEDFDYSKSSPAYPFKLGENIVLLRHDYISNDNGQGFWFTDVDYNAETRDLYAVAEAHDFGYVAHFRGKLTRDDTGIYLTPHDMSLVPVPFDGTTDENKIVPIRIDSAQPDEMWNYIESLNLDLNDVTIGFKKLRVDRKNSELSYTVEIQEIYNGSENYFERQNSVLEMMKVYGLVADGTYGMEYSNEFAYSKYQNIPELKLTPMSMLNYDFTDSGYMANDAYYFLGWYEAYKNYDEIQKMDFDKVDNIAYKFRRVITVDAKDFEETVTKYFNVSVDELRQSVRYNAESGTYSADFSNWPFMSADFAQHLDFYRIGDTIQLSIYSSVTDNYQFITVKLQEDGSYKFMEMKSTPVGFDIVPECFYSDLFEE